MAGTVVDAPFARGKPIAINTSGISFFCAGVFFGLSKGVGADARRRGADDDAPNQSEEFLHLTDAEAKALVGRGLSADLVNRLSTILPLETKQPVQRRRTASPPRTRW
jgi:ATP-dependent protease Clp ATPase subunit